MTRARLMRRVAYVFFAAYAVFVTFPGVLPFRGPRPFILGMPLPMAWIASWVIGGGIVLWLLDRAHAGSDPVQDAGGDGVPDAGADRRVTPGSDYRAPGAGEEV